MPPLISIRRPTDQDVEQFGADQQDRPFSYPEVGATRGEAPPGYVQDRVRAHLGHGLETYQRAQEAIRSWTMFPRQIAELFPATPPIQEGTIVALRIRSWGLWALSSCRIVYTVDETTGSVRRFGFAYGTLPGHLEVGEECFLVQHDADDQVWYDLNVFSRPGHWLSRIGYPVVRRAQKAFQKASSAAMRQAVLSGTC